MIEVTAHPKMIAICNCGRPVVPTFKFSKAEYYCCRCKKAREMFGVRRVAETVEMVAALEMDTCQFLIDSKDCVARGERRRDCEECQQGEDHSEHISDQEREASRNAYDRLLGREPIQ